MPRFADSVALRIASGTSRALPWPKPTRPFWSPITTSAAKPNRLPPLTTFATRLMWTSLSTNSLSRSSRPPLWPPPRSRSPAMVFSNLLEAKPLSVQNQLLEAQSAFAGRICERLDAPVIEILTAIEHHFLDALLHGAFRQQLADGLGRIDVGARIAAIAHGLFQRRGGSERFAFQVVDDLGVDVLRRTEHRQTRTSIGYPAQRVTHALLAPGIRDLE